MSYYFFRNLLFKFSPETAHELTLELLAASERLGINGLVYGEPIKKPVTCMGLEFINPVGLAAGLDKNADCIDALGRLGFGSIEVGTVTPRPQPGNPKPRMFRLPKHEGLINRMGFNNKGVDHLVANLERSKYSGIKGVNIGKNFDTPVEKAHEDYEKCLDKVYAVADYITVNISSPNTPGLRDLQLGDTLKVLLDAVKNKQAQLKDIHQKHTPIAIKIAPDMNDEDLVNIAACFNEFEVDAVIATNTTINKSAVKNHLFGNEQGGLSGAPLTQRANKVIEILHTHLNEHIPVIGVGGIITPEDALAKRENGAKLVQVYTGFIYHGPDLVKRIVQAW